MTVIRVLIVDDQAAVRSGLRSMLERTADLLVVGEAGDGAEAGALAHRVRPDVILMDIRMPGTDGIRATADILTGIDTRVIVLTTFDLDEYVFATLREGASGFLTKNTSPEQLREAIRLVAAGQGLLDPAVTRRVIETFVRRASPVGTSEFETLTPREREIACLIATGMTNNEISEHLTLSLWTVKTHVARILNKLGARERAQVVIAAYEAGAVKPQEQ